MSSFRASRIPHLTEHSFHLPVYLTFRGISFPLKTASLLWVHSPREVESPAAEISGSQRTGTPKPRARPGTTNGVSRRLKSCCEPADSGSAVPQVSVQETKPSGLTLNWHSERQWWTGRQLEQCRLVTLHSFSTMNGIQTKAKPHRTVLVSC